jgi:CHAD domain-containing protein
VPALPDAPWEAWALEREGALKGDPEAIHRLRVAANRLRAACGLSGSIPPARLLKFARALGRVRTLDRHRALLTALPCDPDSWPDRAREAVLARIIERRRPALKALRRRLRTSPFVICDAPPVPFLSGSIEGLQALARGADGGTEALHDLRRALRTLRYALEWRDSSDPALQPLKRLAWTLGLHRDWLLFEALLAKRARRWTRQGRRRLAAGAEALRGAAALQRKEVQAALTPLAEAFLEARRAEGSRGA